MSNRARPNEAFSDSTRRRAVRAGAGALAAAQLLSLGGAAAAATGPTLVESQNQVSGIVQCYPAVEYDFMAPDKTRLARVCVRQLGG